MVANYLLLPMYLSHLSKAGQMGNQRAYSYSQLAIARLLAIAPFVTYDLLHMHLKEEACLGRRQQQHPD